MVQDSTRQEHNHSTEIARRKGFWIGHTLQRLATGTTKQALKWNLQDKRKVERPLKTQRRSSEVEMKMSSITRNIAEKMARNRIH